MCCQLCFLQKNAREKLIFLIFRLFAVFRSRMRYDTSISCANPFHQSKYIFYTTLCCDPSYSYFTICTFSLFSLLFPQMLSFIIGLLLGTLITGPVCLTTIVERIIIVGKQHKIHFIRFNFPTTLSSDLCEISLPQSSNHISSPPTFHINFLSYT